LAVLAGLDLATAHGTGHYSGSILHARSAGELRDVLERRYSAAWRELRNHAMPAATAIALLCAALAWRFSDRLLAPVCGDRAWRAIRRRSASLARPSWGGAVTRASSTPSRSPTISFARARGCTRTVTCAALIGRSSTWRPSRAIICGHDAREPCPHPSGEQPC